MAAGEERKGWRVKGRWKAERVMAARMERKARVTRRVVRSVGRVESGAGLVGAIGGWAGMHWREEERQREEGRRGREEDGQVG